MNEAFTEIRNSFTDEAYRRAFDAFMVALDYLDLSEEKQLEFAQTAQRKIPGINWESYERIRATVIEISTALISWFAPSSVTREERNRITDRMYTRFMEGRIYLFEYLAKEEACQVKPYEVGKDDFHNRDMAMLFAHIPYDTEVAGYLREIEVSWTYEQLHMVTWFSAQMTLGRGYYSRKRPNLSAKVTYQRLLNPYSLLWIAATLGEDRETVLRVGRSIMNQKSFMVMSNMVRKEIPWTRIYELAGKRMENAGNI